MKKEKVILLDKVMAISDKNPMFSLSEIFIRVAGKDDISTEDFIKKIEECYEKGCKL